MAYNLTDAQKDLLREIVAAVRNNQIREEFSVLWAKGGPVFSAADGFTPANSFTRGKLEALAAADLIHLQPFQNGTRITLTGSAYQAVDDDFSAPDTSFLTQLTPLADVTNFDAELKKRVLPILVVYRFQFGGVPSSVISDISLNNR